MSYYPPTTNSVYQESASRGVLLGRLGLHTYAPGHDRTHGLSAEDLATALRQASENPFNWTEQSLEAYTGVLIDVNNCPHTACTQASTKGPVGLKRLIKLHIGDKQEFEHGMKIERILSEYQDLMSGAKLGMAKDRLKSLASLFVEPSKFDDDTAISALRDNLGDRQIPVNFSAYTGVDQRPVPPQTRLLSARYIRGSDQVFRPIFSSDGPISLIEDVQARVDSEFAGTRRAVTRVNAHWYAFHAYLNTIFPDNTDDDWTLESVKTGHLSGAAWNRPESGSYRLTRR